MIPKKFKLMGAEYTVNLVGPKKWPDDEAVGLCNFLNQEISILSAVSEVQQQQTFCHELVHCILDKMGENDLNDNEQFVDLFGSLLHQAWTTCK
jgi:Zn-dependent peptidase ImmA (M78 family)